MLATNCMALKPSHTSMRLKPGWNCKARRRPSPSTLPWQVADQLARTFRSRHQRYRTDSQDEQSPVRGQWSWPETPSLPASHHELLGVHAISPFPQVVGPWLRTISICSDVDTSSQDARSEAGDRYWWLRKSTTPGLWTWKSAAAKLPSAELLRLNVTSESVQDGLPTLPLQLSRVD